VQWAAWKIVQTQFFLLYFSRKIVALYVGKKWILLLSLRTSEGRDGGGDGGGRSLGRERTCHQGDKYMLLPQHDLVRMPSREVGSPCANQYGPISGPQGQRVPHIASWLPHHTHTPNHRYKLTSFPLRLIPASSPSFEPSVLIAADCTRSPSWWHRSRTVVGIRIDNSNGRIGSVAGSRVCRVHTIPRDRRLSGRSHSEVGAR